MERTKRAAAAAATFVAGPQDRRPGFGETILKTAPEIDGQVVMDFAPERLTVTARGRKTDAPPG